MSRMHCLKQKCIRLFFATALLASTPVLLGWAGDLDGIRESVAFITAIQAEFTQEKHLEILDDPLISKGALYFKAPYSLRWEYLHPVRSVLLMEDETIRQYAQAGQGMVAQKNPELEAMRVFLREICMWMQGRFRENPDLDVHFAGDGRVVLTPVAGSAVSMVIRGITLRLTDTPGVIESVTIHEDAETYTVIRFHDTKINRDIDGRVFRQLEKP